MKWIEVKIVFDHPDKDLAVDLISDVFYDFGLQGVVVDDPRIEPEEGWPEDVIGRPDHYTVTGYFTDDNRIEQRCKILEEKLLNFKEKLGLNYRISYKELDEEDWAHSWKAYFWPQKIGRNMVVKPTWRDYQADPGDLVIELDPGMAFGTGTHPTTTMCVALIESLLKKGDSFLDVGTGSGILLIAAVKLGAANVCGIDHDRTAVAIAAGNLKLNDIGTQQVRVICGDLVGVIREKYDIITANILSHVILILIKDIRRVLKPGGVFICSGIVDKNEKQVVDAMENVGFEIIAISSKDEWVAIAGRLTAKEQRRRAKGIAHGAEGDKS
jgi:ribosomal protein L11 methyltransferase